MGKLTLKQLSAGSHSREEAEPRSETRQWPPESSIFTPARGEVTESTPPSQPKAGRPAVWMPRTRKGPDKPTLEGTEKATGPRGLFMLCFPPKRDSDMKPEVWTWGPGGGPVLLHCRFAGLPQEGDSPSLGPLTLPSARPQLPQGLGSPGRRRCP